MTQGQSTRQSPMSGVAFLLGAVAIVLALIVATALLLRWFVRRPTGDDVGDRAELNAVQAQLATLDACHVSYGRPVRGSDALRRQYGYLYVKECADGALSVAVPLDEAQWQRGAAMELQRSARSERWGVFVDKRAVTLQATVNALEVFAPVLVARYPAQLSAQRAALGRVELERNQRENSQQTQQQQNEATWR